MQSVSVRSQRVWESLYAGSSSFHVDFRMEPAGLAIR